MCKHAKIFVIDSRVRLMYGVRLLRAGRTKDLGKVKMTIIGSLTKRVTKVKISEKPVGRRIEKLPWPRTDPDGTVRGIDVAAKRKDVIKIVYKYFKVSEVGMDELLQEVFLAIIHKNHGRSAHNPSKSSFGHYVYMVANNVCINLVHRKKRFEKERDSIDTNYRQDDDRSFLETHEVAEEEPDTFFMDQMEELETVMRQKGMWDLARYIRTARSGASPEVIREALSFGGRKVTNKAMRDIRHQVREAVRELAVA